MGAVFLKLFIALCALCAAPAPTVGQQAAPGATGPVRIFKFRGELALLLMRLAEAHQLTIGLEAPGRDSNCWVDVNLRGVDFRGVLGAVVVSSPGYEWREGGAPAPLDFRPASGRSELLDVEVSRLRLRDADWDEALAALMGLPEVRSAVTAADLTLRHSPTWIGPQGRRFSLDVEKTTVGMALHEIAKRSGGHIWVFRRYGAGSKFLSITNGPPVAYRVMPPATK
jgi:hypothetical protein